MELTLPTVVGAALVDRVNPCAFALLLVFVATLLAMLQRQAAVIDATHARCWLLFRGGVYISGIFLMYLALGFGLLGALGLAKALSSTMLVSKVAALFALGLGLMMLQEALLPEFGTRLGAHVDTTRLRKMVSHLGVPGLFGAGVLVGLCTVPCSGAVYLAVLALLSAQATAQATALAGAGYLVLYNLVFVAPLVIILALASSRLIYRKMARWQLHHRPSLKLATGVAAITVGLITLVVV